MSWLDRPVTWKWYLGIAVVSIVLSALTRPRVVVLPPGVKP